MSDCPFCDYEKLRAERPVIVHEGLVMEFEPLLPVTPGHRLFVPIPHVEHAASDPNLTGLVCAYAAQAAAEQPGAFNLITSAGTDATQSVPHLHWHLVPRRPGDGLELPWSHQTEALPGAGDRS
jgi:histidine triad (HIT) family protein